MILTGPEIAQQVERDRIHISPFNYAQLNPNSYNYRLGDELISFDEGVIDPKREFRTSRHSIRDRGFILMPGKLYLAHTLEQIGSPHYVSSLIGRSSMGRLGLWLQVTADLGHIGNRHNWTLELKVVQPLRVYAGMEIGQVTFWETSGSQQLLYSGKYAQHITAEPSHIKVELEG